MEHGNLILAYLLIAVGFLLLVGELFFTSGTLLVLALTAIAAGIALAFSQGSTTGVYTLLGVLIALPVFGGLLARYWTRTRFGRRMLLTAPDEDATVASMPVNLELEQLRGASAERCRTSGRPVCAISTAGAWIPSPRG